VCGLSECDREASGPGPLGAVMPWRGGGGGSSSFSFGKGFED
jgi:hypothetical protein